MSDATAPLYHVRLSVRGRRHDEVALDLSRDRLETEFLQPYRQGRPIVVNGRSAEAQEIERIRITVSPHSAEEFRSQVERDLRQPATGQEGGPSMSWRLAASGRDVTDDLVPGPPGYAAAGDSAEAPLDAARSTLAAAQSAEGPGDHRSVFLVHGRDGLAASAMRDLLLALGLRLIEWEHAVGALGKGPSPYVGDVVLAGMRLADAVVVLATPDDLVRLRRDLADDDEVAETRVQGQARANVIYEAGIADAIGHSRTVLIELGRVKGLSDLGGRNTVRFDGSAQSRHKLASRLRAAGLDVDDRGEHWLSAGDFTSPLQAARTAVSNSGRP